MIAADLFRGLSRITLRPRDDLLAGHGLRASKEKSISIRNRGIEATAMVGVLGGLLFWMHRDLVARLAYPPVSDQTMYFAGASLFADHLKFQCRAPLYSLWMGLFYIGANHDMQLCFYVEKYASIAALSLATALLGRQLFDIRTGLLMGVWVLNCKYFVTETNGSHGLAASLLVCSLLALLRRDGRSRVPVALLFLFLSTQVRSEMWVPFGAIIAALSVRFALDKLGDGEADATANRSMSPYWPTCIAASLCLALIFNSRSGLREPGRLAEAFAMNYALNYLDRYGVDDSVSRQGESSQYAPWMEVWVVAFPGVSQSAEAIERNRDEIQPFKAIIKYPERIASHVWYNVTLSFRALPAVFLAFDRPYLMLMVWVIYLASLFAIKPGQSCLDPWLHTPAQVRRLLLLWVFAIFLLVPISFIFRVVGRYYVPLIPAQIAIATFAVRVVFEKATIVLAGCTTPPR